MGDKVDPSRGLRGLEPRARGGVDLIALVLGSELLYYYPLSPTEKFLCPWDNGNFLSHCLIVKLAFLYNNG